MGGGFRAPSSGFPAPLGYGECEMIRLPAETSVVDARRRDWRAEFQQVGSVTSLFGNGLRSFRTFLANSLRVAAAAARSLNFPPLHAVAPFDLDAWHGKWGSYRRPLFDDGPILGAGRQRSCGDEHCA